MRDNHISTDYVNVFPDGKSPVSLAFLDDNSDAEYIFYKDYPKQRLDVIYPKLEEDDIVVIGSYYALNTEPPGTAAEGCSLRKIMSIIVSPMPITLRITLLIFLRGNRRGDVWSSLQW